MRSHPSIKHSLAFHPILELYLYYPVYTPSPATVVGHSACRLLLYTSGGNLAEDTPSFYLPTSFYQLAG